MTSEIPNAVITFTVPENYADRMTRTSKAFYLDVFGRVRDEETTDVIGYWWRTDGKAR